MGTKNNISRRQFLGQASCAAVGSTSIFNTLFNLKSISSFLGQSTTATGDYKALVCLLNAGGLDSFNMLVRKDTSGYNEYAATRSNLALARSSLLDISYTIDGKTFGLHPALPRMRTMFNTGKLSFVSNVGTLIQPTTKTQFYNGSVPLPLGLYSHSDQVLHWQTGIPDQRLATGWAGKIADLLSSANQNQTVSMNISLSGSNVFQTGNNSVEFSLHPENGALGINGFNNDWIYNTLKTNAINGMVNGTYQDVFKKTYVEKVKKGIDGKAILSPILDNPPVYNVPFSDNDLSKSFRMIANTIAGREQLGVTRQIFFVEFGGWDHHDELLQNQIEMFTVLDNALYEFDAALSQLNVNDCVTTFSLSEFARTLTSNGNGTDHAWGSNVFVLGGPVNGTQLYGQFPSLVLGNANPLEIGGGVLIPTVSTDAYFAEIAMWFGVPASELSTLFPNIGHFYDTGSGDNPIGFLDLN